MIYLLDTNVCIKLLNKNNTAVVNKLKTHQPEEIYLPTIVQFELYYGAYKNS
jgi:tRNA(fMet)-specific endonuclease VapC